MAPLSVLFFALLTSLFFLSVSCQVVVPSQVAVGQPFTVYCKASDVNLLYAFNSVEYRLVINKMGPNYWNEVARYTYSLNNPSRFDTINRDGRDWNFTMIVDGPDANNRQNMTIVWEVLDTKCEDAVPYRCETFYPDSTIFGNSSSTSENLTVFDEPSRFNFDRIPNFRVLQYTEGEIVTFICKISGPDTLKFEWERWVPSSSGTEQLESLSSDAVIANTTTRSPVAYGYCSGYDLQSTLTFPVDATYAQETYKCIVSNNSQEVERGNITIDILYENRPIVDAKDPRDVETFTITCDASRVTIPHSEGRAITISELVLEARLDSSKAFDKMAQYVACGPPGRSEYQNKIPGRDWVFNFTGANSGHNNMATMRIEIQVRDPKHTDAGLYRCTVRYFSAQSGLVEVSQQYTLTTNVLPIVNKELRNNRQLQMVKCDARRVEVPGPNISSEVVGALVIQVKLDQYQPYTKIAEYLSYGPQENLQFQNKTVAKDWVFTFAGSNNGVNNRKTMSLDYEVWGTWCSTTQTFMCQVMFYSSSEGTVWLQQEQTVVGFC